MTPSSDETPRILPELSVVRLANAVESADGVIPKGSTGTVVARYAGGRGYEIEFTRPFHTVATVDVSDLARMRSLPSYLHQRVNTARPGRPGRHTLEVSELRMIRND